MTAAVVLGVLASVLMACSSSQQGSGSSSESSSVPASSSSVPASADSSGVSSSAAGSSDTASAAASSTGSAGASSTAADGSLADAVPAKYRSAGKILVGIELNFPPFVITSTTSDAYTGVVPELMEGISKRLNIPLVAVPTGGIETMVPGLTAGRFDMHWDATSETADRLKQVDFVDFIKSSTGWVVAAGNPKNITSYETMCGITAAIPKGTIHVKLIAAASDKCVAAGKPAITQDIVDSSPASVLSVLSNRADLAPTSVARATYIAQTSDGKLSEVTDQSDDGVINGVAFLKTDNGLRDAISKALQSMMDDGSYGAILNKYGLTTLALTKATVRTSGS